LFYLCNPLNNKRQDYGTTNSGNSGFDRQDAVRFEKLRMEVESLTKEQRAENSRKLKEAAKKAKEYISICL